MKRTRFFLALSLAIAMVSFLLFVSTTPLITQAEMMSPAQRVQQAWQNAQQSGVYHFATNIEQTTFPAPTLANVGRSARIDQLFIQGETNLPNQTLLLTLWSGGGSALNPQDGIEIRIEGEEAYGRQIGGAWQEINNFSDSFAPGGDLTAYLAGAKHVQRTIDADATTQSFTHYTFALDGPDFAAHLRDQLETELLRKGELPAGLNLDVSEQFKDITGHGEIWIDAQNMPLRLSIHLDYPRQANGQRIEANIQTDFSRFEPLKQAHNPMVRLASAFGLPVTANDWGQTTQEVATIFGFVGLSFLMLYYRRSKPVYATFAILIILSMVGTPLLHSQQVYAFSKRMDAQQAEQEQEQQSQADAQAAQEELTAPIWNPNTNPLANDNVLNDTPTLQTNFYPLSEKENTASANLLSQIDTTDTDNDGLTDTEETKLGTNINKPDSDSDGLNDGVEVLRLGTDPLSADSDLDGITDYLEVTGFTKANGSAPWYDKGEGRWYSDPNNPDTNNDGLPDGLECHSLADNTGSVCRDTDGDNTPDIFDVDNDGDGVNDRVDLSPYTSFGDAAPFSHDNPFQLTVDNITPDYPVFVDIQLRPTNDKHLTYALNVLDWPTGDESGQIQRRLGNHSTFANGMTDAEIALSPANQNGDMRLIPMLEIEIPWNNAPLSKIPAATSVKLYGEDVTPSDTEPIYTSWLTASVAMKTFTVPNGNASLHFEFDFDGQNSIDSANIYPGNCSTGATGDAIYHYTNLADGDTREEINDTLNSIADGTHLILLEKDNHTPACATIPDIPDGGKRGKMIDLEPLQPYGVTIKDKDNEGTLLAYVPLNVVNDETGGARVAFSARIPYQLSVNGWGDAHKIRAVWVLQMLNDYCRPMPNDYPEPFASAQKDSWCQMDVNWVTNNTENVHTYDEEWTLTGISVREDHGLEVAIAYEDPAAETEAEREFDNWLWGAAYGMENAFISGKDEDKNGVRDIGLITQKEGVTVADNLLDINTVRANWGIPVTSSLRIQSYPSYDHQDHVAQIMMTETVKILDDHFSAYQGQGANAPTLLFAREERYRTVGLDSVNSISTTGNALTLDLSLANHKLETLATMNWAPYRYQNGEWQSYRLDEYWDLMGSRLQNVFPADNYPESGEEISLGATTIAKSFYLSMVQGRVGLAKVGNLLTTDESNPAQTDAAIESFMADAISVGGELAIGVIKLTTEEIAKTIYKVYQTNVTGVYFPNIASKVLGKAEIIFKAFGGGVKQGIKDTIFKQLKGLLIGSRMERTAAKLAIASVVIVVSVVTLTIASYFVKNATAAFVIQTVLDGLKIIGAIVAVTQAALAIKKLASAAKSIGDAINTSVKSVSKAAVVLAVIGTVIAVVVTWGVFIATMVAAGVKFWSSGFNAALAGAIAATVTAVVMLAIAFIPIVGQIIVAIVALVDAVIFALCGAFNWGEGKVGQHVCKGISGWFSEGVKWLIYNYTVMVDMEADDRFQLSQFDQNFSDVQKGVSVGNSINYSAHITNTIDLVSVPTDWKAVAYGYQYNTKNLKSSTFDYRWQSDETDIHDALSRNTMKQQWQLTDGNRPVYMSQDLATDAIKNILHGGFQVSK